ESVAAELRELGSDDVHTITADLVQTAEAQRVVHEVRASWGAPDVLVNNAAATFIGPFLDVPVSRWKTALALNLLAPVALIHGFLPDMLERDAGRIINITSAAARTRDLPPKDVPQLSYSASKAALDAFSYGLMHDLDDTGVALDLVAPVVLTESVEYHLTGPRFDDLKRRMALMGPFGEAVARIADQPPSFRGHYLENHDLEALGFLV
ncbi:MAG TPA: SDR family NAD(P)-dependent oxidoreductase, partial [Acidimicrobiia bacterium]|nr:SDR family NAD(P)-dependent oxidoreductase [Acidimicrobiia bacterium]